MKIAVVFSNPFPPQEGQGNYVYYLSRKLIERGHKVFVVTRGREFCKFTFDEMEVYRLPFIKVYPFHITIHGIFVSKLLKSLDECVDIIHFHTPLPPPVSTRIPSIVTFHTPLLADSQALELLDFHSALPKIFGIFASRIEKSLIRSSRVITVVSDSVAYFLKKYYRVNKEVIVLGNAVSDEFFKQRDATAKDEKDHNILFVGRLDPRKGLFDLIDCMKIIVEREPNARLVIIGKGPLLAPIINRICKLGLQRHVEIKGFVSRKRLLDAYSNASIFVLPSYYEGLPTVILEAMACGLPIVATRVPGTSEIIEDGITGILVPPRSATELAYAILYLLSNPDIRQEFGERGKRLAEEKFTWDIVAKRVLAVYNTALSA